MFNKKDKKFTSYICILSLFSSNIYAMMPEKEKKIEINKKENKPNIIPIDDILLKSFPWATMSETYQTPTKSKLMLQDPKMSEEFKKFVYEDLCPEPLKKLIRNHKFGQKSFPGKLDSGLPRFCVLYGPNGTGKSTLSVLIAKELGIKLLFINSGFLGTMYRKSEEVNLGEEIAPLLEDGTPCVIVIDEADTLIGKIDKDDNSNKNKSSALAQMMDMLEKKPNFILVWTTNHIDQIDSKFRNRISVCERIDVNLPNQQERERIIKYLVEIQKKRSNDNLEITCEFNDFTNIAKKTEGLSIRAIEQLVKNAYLAATDRASKKYEIEGNKQEKKTIIFTENDFTKTCKKIVTGTSNDKKAESNKNTKKTIKDYGLIGCVITLVCTVFGTGITYLISQQSLNQTKAIQKENKIMQYIQTGVTGTGIAAATIIGIIALCLGKK